MKVIGTIGGRPHPRSHFFESDREATAGDRRSLELRLLFYCSAVPKNKRCTVNVAGDFSSNFGNHFGPGLPVRYTTATLDIGDA
jgi:hypothetical protein